MRLEPDDISHMLPLDEVVAALGATSRSAAKQQMIPLDSIVGTVDRRHSDFDREFRPSASARSRCEAIALAREQGQELPPTRANDVVLLRSRSAYF